MSIFAELEKYRQKFTKFLWNKYASDVGTSLIDLGALGWLLSATAQVGMIKKRKDLDEKEKDFMLTQEKADGFFNVVSYYTICEAIKQTGDRLLEKGHIMTASTNKALNAVKKSTNSLKDYVQSMGETVYRRKFIQNAKKSQSMTNFYKGSLFILNKLKLPKDISPADAEKHSKWVEKILKNDKIIQETFEPIIQNDKIDVTRRLVNKAFKEYSSFKVGVGVFSAVFASVLSCNIITPIFRNMTANYFQEKKKKYYDKRADMKKAEITQFYAYRTMPATKTYNAFKI